MTADTTPARTLKDAFGTKPAHMSRRRRERLQLSRGEPHPIAGEPIALDERPHPDLRSVTFDGAAPPRDD